MRVDLDDPWTGLVPAALELTGYESIVGIDSLRLPASVGHIILSCFQGACSGVPFDVVIGQQPITGIYGGWDTGRLQGFEDSGFTGLLHPPPPSLRHDDAPRATRPPLQIERGIRPVLPLSPPLSLRPPWPPRRKPRSKAGPRLAAPPAASLGLAPLASRCGGFEPHASQLREPGCVSRLSLRH